MFKMKSLSDGSLQRVQLFGGNAVRRGTEPETVANVVTEGREKRALAKLGISCTTLRWAEDCSSTS